VGGRTKGDGKGERTSSRLPAEYGAETKELDT